MQALLLLIVPLLMSVNALSVSGGSKRAVLWDVDGTLSDSFRLGYDSTLAVLKNVNVEITEDQYHQGTKLTTPRRLAWHVTGNPDDPVGVGLGKQFDDLYVELVSTATAPFYSGMMDVLDAVEKQDGVVLGALSNACGAYVEAVLRVNGVTDRFRIGLGADDVPAAKPAPDGLLFICNRLGVDPSACVYVGDSPSDGHAAAAAGMKSVGVTWGSHPESTVRPAFTETVHTPEDLRRVLLTMLDTMVDGKR
jgi:HAD superfamily hydrolase (TIGR01509 family)